MWTGGLGKWVTLFSGTGHHGYRNEVLRGQVCSLLVLGHPPFRDPGHLYSWFSGPWLRLVPILLTHLTFKPSNLNWNYTTGFPVHPAYSGQMVGLLSLHNHVSQFLIINVFLHILYVLILLALFLWRAPSNISWSLSHWTAREFPTS